MQFKKVFISELSPAQYNPRKDLQPDDPEYQRIKASIEEFGYVDPVIINSDYTVIGGHQRLKVLKDLGQAQIDVVVVDLPKTKEKALNIALNKITGAWDDGKLMALLNELKAEDYDISITGFDDKEFKALEQELRNQGEAQEDNYEPPPEIVTDIKRGDIFQLGRNRVMCGDSTSKEDVTALMDGKKADMVFTDPPYGVSYSEKNTFLNTIAPGNRIQTPIESDNVSEKEIMRLWKASFEIIRDNLAEVNSYYIFGPQIQGMMMMMMMMEAGLPYRHVEIWVKNNHVLGRCDYHYRHEPIFFGWTKTHKFYGKGKFQTSVWEVDKPLKNDLHPTMKPVALVENALLNSSLPDQICLDSFLGSGTTLIACEQLNRICYGMEISPQYCEVICQRWEKLTGKKREKVTGG